MAYLLTHIIADQVSDKQKYFLMVDVFLKKLKISLSQHNYARALQITKDFAEQWPENKTARFSIRQYQRLVGETFDFIKEYESLMPLIQNKKYHILAHQPIVINMNMLARLVETFTRVAAVEEKLARSLHSFQTNLHDVRAMVQMATYDYEVILKLPENLYNLRTRLKSFTSLNALSDYPVYQKQDAQGKEILVFPNGLNDVLISELRNVFYYKRAELRDYIEAFIRMYKDKNPRVLSVKFDFRNVLTGMKISREHIIALIQKQLIPLSLAKTLEDYNFTVVVPGPHKECHIYTYSQIIDHNMEVLRYFGDMDIFTGYAQNQIMVWLDDYVDNRLSVDQPEAYTELVAVREKRQQQKYEVTYLPDKESIIVSGGSLSAAVVVSNGDFSRISLSKDSLIKIRAAANRLTERYSPRLCLEQGQRYFAEIIAEARRFCDFSEEQKKL